MNMWRFVYIRRIEPKFITVNYTWWHVNTFQFWLNPFVYIVSGLSPFAYRVYGPYPHVKAHLPLWSTSGVAVRMRLTGILVPLIRGLPRSTSRRAHNIISPICLHITLLRWRL